MTVTLDFNAVTSDPSTRRTLTDISLAVAKGKKIVVVTGAGISCSCGIPDFRSSDGLYALVKEKYPDVVMKGRDLFDASLFRDATSTAVFYTFISGLKRSIDAAQPAPTHHFIKTLDSKKKLLRSYTQNIDGFESQVGLLGSSCHEAKSTGKGKTKLRTKEVRNVQLHGDIHRVRCMACSAEYPCAEEHLQKFEQGTAPDCPECLSRSQARMARSARAIRVGSLRPAIVLYDETHPLGDDIGTIHTTDINRKPDMLIIMGTSLKVHGLKKLVKDFAKSIHSAPSTSTSSPFKKPYKVIFVNKTPPGAEWNDVIDYHICGESDSWSAKVIEDWKKMRPADWEIQQTLVSADTHNVAPGALKVAKSTVSKNKVQKPRKENRPPTPQEPPSNESTSKSVPQTPSKRRTKTSHYDDQESSPSKKRFSTKDQDSSLPEGSGKLLFGNATNIQAVLSDEPGELSKMDISICVHDLSMRDADDDVFGSGPKTPARSKTSREVENSPMNISVADISMKELLVTPLRAKAPPTKPAKKAPRPPTTKRPIAMRSRRKVVVVELASRS